MFLKLAWRNIWRNKRRSFITMASVFFAVMLAVIMYSITLGVMNNMVKNVVSFYTGYVQVHQKGYWDEQTIDNTLENTDSLHALLTHIPHVTGTVPRLESFALASSSELTKGVLVIGTDMQAEDQLTSLKKKLIAGNYLTNNQQAVIISEGLAKFLKMNVNDTLVILGQGYHGVNAAGKYPISGIVKFGSPDLNNRTVYLPLHEAQLLYGAENRLTSIALMVDKPDLAEDIATNAGKALGSNYEVMDWKQMLPELNQTIEGAKAEHDIEIGVLYMIVAFGIFGTILMMIAERIKEFGILVAVGMKKLQLAIIVIMETVIISILGAVLGMLGSLPFVAYLHYNPISLASSKLGDVYSSMGIEPVIISALEPSVFIREFTIILVVALILSLYPIYSISKLDPVKAMRS